MSVSDESLRLGYVVSQYPATNHTFILREIRTLRRLGFDIQVVSVRKPDRPFSALSCEEAEEARVTYSVLGAGIGQMLAVHLRTMFTRPLCYARGLIDALRMAEWNLRLAFYNVIYFAEAVMAGDYFHRRGVSHTHTHFASTVTLLMVTVFPKIAFSVTIHGPDEFNDVVGFHMAEKVAQARFIAAISRYAASQTIRASLPRYWNKILTLPLGVDPSVFVPQPKPPGSTFEILCVARLAAAKAHHVLIAAVGKMVARGCSNVRLTLVGDGPERAALEKAIQEQYLQQYVYLAGRCNHDRIAEYYRQADVFGLASFAEGVPVVLMEAMAMEICCVSTWITGVPELIRTDIDGLLVAPADADALADAIIRLMENPELARKLGRSGRQRVMEKYDLAKNTLQLGQVFRGCLGGSGVEEIVERQEGSLVQPRS